MNVEKNEESTLIFNDLIFSNSPKFIVLHHSGTGGDPSAAEIHAWHLRRGFSGVGYHFVIRGNGDVELARTIAAVGAHTKGLNDCSIGICLSGTNATDMQIAAFLTLARQLMNRFKIAPDAVIGHREINELAIRGRVNPELRINKSCPGPSIHMPQIRALLRGAEFQNGVDVLERSQWDLLKGRQIGLLTNQTGRLASGQLTRHAMQTSDLALKLIFTPEHGLKGKSFGAIENSVLDQLPIISLHTRTVKAPSAEHLSKIDTVVVDLQDAGCRFFSYISLLRNVLTAAKKSKVRVVVLDRPNPLNGVAMEGPLLPPSRFGFNIGPCSIPIRYGMTMGELALMMNQHVNAGLEIVKMTGWNPHRGIPLDRAWHPLSPNLQTEVVTMFYAGIGMLEPYLKRSALDLGRGGNGPSQQIAAPWLDPELLVDELYNFEIPDLDIEIFQETTHQHQHTKGLNFKLRPFAQNFNAVQLSLALAMSLYRRFPDHFPIDTFNIQLAHPESIENIRQGATVQTVMAGWSEDLAKFRKIRESFLLYRRGNG